MVQAVGSYQELQNNPVLQEVLEINKKNLEASKQQLRQSTESDSLLESTTKNNLLSASQMSDMKLNKSAHGSIAITGERDSTVRDSRLL